MSKGIFGECYLAFSHPSLILGVFSGLRAGGCLREHPPHHAGHEQRGDAFRRGEQCQ